MVNVRVLEDRALVYSHADLASPVIAELRNGDQFVIGPAATTAGVSWCTAILPDGRPGYVPGTIKIYRIREVTLNQPSVDVLSAPAAGSSVLATCHRGERFTVSGIKSKDGVSWVEVRTGAGAVGYVPAATSITEDKAAGGQGMSPAKQAAKRSLIRGGLYFGGGILITVVTYAMASSSPGGGRYFIAWGAILFGGIRFVSGLIAYLSAD